MKLVVSALLVSFLLAAVNGAQASGQGYPSFTSGFNSGSAIAYNGSATLLGTAIQLTQNTNGEAGSVWFNQRVPVNAFVTDFSFQMTNALADGMTFTIQAAPAGLNAIGGGGAGLGFYGLPHSFALKFDIYNNSGEGNDSIGIFTDGEFPDTPFTDLSFAGIELNSGNLLQAHLSYDGTTLALTLTDTVTGSQLAQSWLIDIPSTIGSKVAYVGFTGGTGGLNADQEVHSWTYQSYSNQQPVPPAFSVSAGPYSSAQTLTISEPTAGALVYYTTDGTTPTTASSIYSGPLTISCSETVSAIAGSSLQSSQITSAQYVMSVSGAVCFPLGFASNALLNVNGVSALSNTTLQLTNTVNAGAGSAWYATPVTINSFVSDFTFKATQALADGMTFAIQNSPDATTALGYAGGCLGYCGIPDSVAIKFDLLSDTVPWDNAVGLYTGGVAPFTPEYDITPFNLSLVSGDLFWAHIAYDGVNMSLTLTDTQTGNQLTHSFPVDIPTAVGGNTAYVGFTGATGGLVSNQFVHTWTFSLPPTNPIVHPLTGPTVSNVSLSSSANPSPLYAPVTFTAVVAPTATGTVAFMDGTTTLGTAPILSGSARYEATSFRVGTHSVTAVYGGDPVFAISTSSPLTQIVTALSSVMELRLTPATSQPGQLVTESVIFSTGGAPAPTGTVGFYVNQILDFFRPAQQGSVNLTQVSTTNLLPYSNTEGGWSIVNGGGGLSESSDTAPDGTDSVVALDYLGTSDTHITQTAETTVSAVPYTFSAWMRSPVGSQTPVNVPISLRDQNGSLSSTQAALTSQWQRFSVTASASASSTEILGSIGGNNSLGSTIIPGVPGSLEVWGAQLEKSAGSGPYVATFGSPATGVGSVASIVTSIFMTGNSPLSTANFVEISYSGDSNYGSIPFSSLFTGNNFPIAVETIIPSGTSPSTLAIATGIVPGGRQYAQYSLALKATGGQPPYTWSYGGNLPAGLEMDSLGFIYGTPTSATSGTTFTVTVVDITQASASTSLSIPVGSAQTATATRSISYTYDTQGRINTATYMTPTGSVTVSYSYDSAGNRTSVITQ